MAHSLLNKQGTDFDKAAVAREAKARIWAAGRMGGPSAARREAFQMSQELRSIARDTNAFVSLAPVLAIVGVVLGVILAVLILAALAPTFFQAVADLTGAFVNADTNSTLANTILGIIAIIVPLVLIFGFIGLVVYVAKFRKGGY